MRPLAAIAFATLGLGACGPQTTAKSDPVASESLVEAPQSTQLPDVAGEYAHCRIRWQERAALAERLLRSERGAREALVNRIGDGSADDRDWKAMLQRDEERAERSRIESADLYRKTDPACFPD